MCWLCRRSLVRFPCASLFAEYLQNKSWAVWPLCQVGGCGLFASTVGRACQYSCVGSTVVGPTCHWGYAVYFDLGVGQ
jgi:hypothetical protein